MIAFATILNGVIRQRHEPTRQLKGGVASKLPFLATQAISAQISGKRCAYTCAILTLAVADRGHRKEKPAMPVAGQHRVKHWEATQSFHRLLPRQAESRGLQERHDSMVHRTRV